MDKTITITFLIVRDVGPNVVFTTPCPEKMEPIMF